MTGIGDLSRRLVLEAPVETDDGAGGVTRSYASAATVWASITPVGASASVVAQALGDTVTHRIVIRPGPALTTQHRFRDGARVFTIATIREREDRRFLEIDAQERAD
jgi:SPP1 family predicted phage head-tail adaptor